MRIGLIGAGRIGGTLARLAVDQGHEVVLSNSRGPETLVDQVRELGDPARAGTPSEAARDGEVVVVSLPLHAIDAIPAAALAGKAVIDTNNYYPARDGHRPELDEGKTTSSELLAALAPEARVVKAFNAIHYVQLGAQGEPAGTPGRRALPIAGDDAEAKRVVAELIDSFGFDVVDAGPLAEGWRFQPGSPAYDVRLDRSGLEQALGEA
jgi:8-hydroxy-5-deazaflavin:NADPH oxidoreductase